MNDERQKIVLRWLYNNCSGKWFTPNVLSPIYNSAGNPPKDIKPEEIFSIFDDLRKLDYILPVINEYGQGCFILNECREGEWLNKISGLNQKKIRKVSGYMIKKIDIIVTSILSSVIGAVIASFVIEYIRVKTK